MSDDPTPNQAQDISRDAKSLVLPPYRGSPGTYLSIEKTREAESRLIEAKTVNPITYSELSFTFNEAYRELKRNLATVGYQLLMADKALETIKSDILLDKYPDFMKDKPKTQDNADLRKAFMMRNDDYLAALDRVAMLKAVEANMDAKVKTMEKVCSYMNTQINLIIKSGLSNANLYVTSGRK